MLINTTFWAEDCLIMEKKFFLSATYGSEVNLFVVSGPSGAGKTLICKKAVENIESLEGSVSATTRKKRPGEKDGIDYCFYSRDEFSRGIKEGAFLEWAEVHGNFYGTAGKNLEKAKNNNTDLLLEIDTQGGEQVRKNFPNAVLIFVAPPSFSELESRLRTRESDSEESIRKRLANAPEEIKKIINYDYLIVNEDLDTAIEDLQSIISAHRCRIKKG